MALTDTQVRALVPRGRAYKKFDGKGLYIEVSPTGSKLWRLKFRFKGTEKRLALGHTQSSGSRMRAAGAMQPSFSWMRAWTPA
jgi:hypothetical protein